MHIKKIIVLFLLLLLVPLSEIAKRNYLGNESSKNEYSQYYFEVTKKGFITEEEMKILEGLPRLDKNKDDDLFRLSLLWDLVVFILFLMFSLVSFKKGHKVYALIIIVSFFMAIYIC